MEPNNLIKETSPYLLQHAYNPVKWYPWADGALRRAKEENKPIFLSVGYSACHWCHVMAHESFENEEVAQIMNENFKNIKVDREERPDIDDIYQKVCQLTTGCGGWPLSVFLTPDQRPFYVGTYFPPLENHGRPGFGSIVRQLAQAWKEKPNDVEVAAENFLNALKKTESISLPSKLDKSILDEAAVNSAQDDDSEGEEGKYYVWKKKEVQEILGDDSDMFCLYYDVVEGGNFEGHNILHNSINLSTAAFHFGKKESELDEILKRCKEKLLETRAKRMPPGRDEKILASWNALMISAFVKGYRVTEEICFLRAAENCIKFIEQKMTKNGKLLHTYKDGQAKLYAYLDDYAYFVNALLDYFESSPSKKYLDLAISYTDYLLEHFC